MQQFTRIPDGPHWRLACSRCHATASEASGAAGDQKFADAVRPAPDFLVELSPSGVFYSVVADLQTLRLQYRSGQLVGQTDFR